MTAFRETALDLPWDVIDACNGFGLDIGKFNTGETIATLRQYTYMLSIKAPLIK